MISTDNLTEVALKKRFDILPPSLREALISDKNIRIITNACTANNIIDQDDILIVKQLASLVILGFVDADDVAEELVDWIGTNTAIASKLQNDLNLQLFAPLKNDINAVYRATQNNEQYTPATTITIKDPATPKIITTAPTVSPSAPSLPPQPLSSIGWSKMKSDAPVISSRIIHNAPSPAPVQSAAIPAPVILQQETPTNAAQKNMDFHITKPSEGAQMEFSKEKEAIKVMPAVIEFNKSIGGFSRSVIPAPAPTPTRTGSANYSEFTSSLSSIPIASLNARKITEITSQEIQPKNLAAPVPSAAPLPPIPKPTTSPTASTPNTAPTPKVIVQDFLQESSK